MAQRENGKDSREEYRRVQARKNRQQDKSSKYADIDNDSTAVKSTLYKKKSMRSEKQRRNAERNRKRMERKRRKGSVGRGLVLLVLQIIAIMVFMFALFKLDMLPSSYLAVIALALILTIAITLATQLSSKGKRIAGKVFSLVITVFMVVGAYYLIKSNTVFADVADDGEYKLDNMVVAVLKDDAAQNISNASSYTFGIQLSKEAENVQAAVENISSETNSSIQTRELSNMPEQAKALMNGEVGAIIYDEDYAEVMNQAVSGYEDSVKIIYTYSIKTDIQELTIDVAVSDEPFSVYISGIDVYGDLDTNSRSDVNIIATVNPKTHQILLSTTPRDFYVEIPHVSQGMKDKLTHAGVYGVEASIDTLEQLYDVDIQFYAKVNFTSLIEIIDILNGVDVESDYTFSTSKASGCIVNIQEGMNHLNGEQALAFCRERKALPDGDNQRGKDQQKVITAIIQKMISPTMIVKASSILDSVGHNVDTNMTADQLRTLIKQQLREGSDWKITSVAAEGTPLSATCYSSGSTPLYVSVPDETSVAAIRDLMDQVINGEILEDSVTASGK